jgi:hypothetical protein
MNILQSFAENLKYAQDHGGIMVVIVLSFIYLEVRFHRKIEDVDTRSKERDARHETYYHNLQLKQNKKGAE